MNNTEINEWEKEIEAVEEGILRWLINPPGLGYMTTEAILRVDINDCHLLGIEYQLWVVIDAVNWLGEDYEYSDIWQCAVAGAIAKFKQSATQK
ncbi:MAG: hypothetical protein AAFV93_21405 [Chloroflexota bacterium]